MDIALRGTRGDYVADWSGKEKHTRVDRRELTEIPDLPRMLETRVYHTWVRTRGVWIA